MGNFVRKDSWLGNAQLRFVELFAWWNGLLSRQDLVDEFGVSAQQASAMIQTYLELNPKAMEYCLKKRRYVASPKMKCIFEEPSLLTEIQKDSFINHNQVSVPIVESDSQVKRYLLTAIRLNRIIKLKYNDIQAGETVALEVAPTSISFDGSRYFLRAFNYASNSFLTLHLLRIDSIQWPEKELPKELPVDAEWHEYIDLKFSINENLGLGDIKELMADYGLKDKSDSISIKCKKAMKSYVLNRMEIDNSAFVLCH